MATTPAGTTTDYIQPDYYNQSSQGFAGGVQDLMGPEGYISDTAKNWYNATPEQGALGQYAQWHPEWQDKVTQGMMPQWDTNKQAGMSAPFQSQYTQEGLQPFLNPYTQNVVNEQARLSNQNLTENVLPQVNSTFAGAGQFGSTRNADFTNRAIRDQQMQLAGQQGNTLMGAQNAANQQYQDWTKMNNQGQQFGAGQYASLLGAEQAAKGAGAQQYMDWTKLGVNAGQQDFNNWLTQANYPISALSQVGGMLGNLRPSNPQAITSSTSGLNNAEQFGNYAGLLNTGLNSGTFGNIIGALGQLFNQQG